MVYANLEDMHVCVTEVVLGQTGFTKNIEFLLYQRPVSNIIIIMIMIMSNSVNIEQS